MSEQTEKLVHIIMPDLLNYLETREIIEQRIRRQQPTYQKEKMEIDDNNNLDDRNATK